MLNRWDATKLLLVSLYGQNLRLCSNITGPFIRITLPYKISPPSRLSDYMGNDVGFVGGNMNIDGDILAGKTCI